MISYRISTYGWMSDITWAVCSACVWLDDREPTSRYLVVRQLRIVASDAGNPPRASDPSDVNIEVIRNDHSPKFERERYTVSMSQTQEPGSVITQVRATDEDPRVSSSWGHHVEIICHLHHFLCDLYRYDSFEHCMTGAVWWRQIPHDWWWFGSKLLQRQRGLWSSDRQPHCAGRHRNPVPSKMLSKLAVVPLGIRHLLMRWSDFTCTGYRTCHSVADSVKLLCQVMWLSPRVQYDCLTLCSATLWQCLMWLFGSVWYGCWTVFGMPVEQCFGMAVEQCLVWLLDRV